MYSTSAGWRVTTIVFMIPRWWAGDSPARGSPAGRAAARSRGASPCSAWGHRTRRTHSRWQRRTTPHRWTRLLAAARPECAQPRRCARRLRPRYHRAGPPTRANNARRHRNPTLHQSRYRGPNGTVSSLSSSQRLNPPLPTRSMLRGRMGVSALRHEGHVQLVTGDLDPEAHTRSPVDHAPRADAPAGSRLHLDQVACDYHHISFESAHLTQPSARTSPRSARTDSHVGLV